MDILQAHTGAIGRVYSVNDNWSIAHKNTYFCDKHTMYIYRENDTVLVIPGWYGILQFSKELDSDLSRVVSPHCILDKPHLPLPLHL